jgi:hypothetical protein
VTEGTQTSGFSINNFALAPISVVAYNPFPLDEVFTMRLGGTDKFGVGREIAEDEDLKISCFEAERIFFRRCRQ